MAEFNLIKTRYGFEFANDDELDNANNKFQVGDLINADIPLKRNWKYHKKMFSFFGFCFNYYSSNNTDMKFMVSKAQQKAFRNRLTILAGYYDVVTDFVTNKTYPVAQSLSFENMEQDEFEECCNAMINAALAHIFNNTKDQNIINQLYTYF